MSHQIVITLTDSRDNSKHHLVWRGLPFSIIYKAVAKINRTISQIGEVDHLFPKWLDLIHLSELFERTTLPEECNFWNVGCYPGTDLDYDASDDVFNNCDAEGRTKSFTLMESLDIDTTLPVLLSGLDRQNGFVT